MLGSFGPDGTYTTAPSGTSELLLEQDAIGTVRVLRHGQLSLVAPMVETRRATPTRTEMGGGFGDVQLSARWDFVYAGESLRVPGIAALASVTVPSGRPPESATLPLASDATGTGSFQGALGLALEQTFGSVLVNVTSTVAYRSPRTLYGARVQPGLQAMATGAVGYTFPDETVVAANVTYTLEGAGSVDGAAIEGGGRRLTRLGLSGGTSLSDVFRVQATAFGDLMLDGFGKNQQAGLGLALTWIGSWS